MDGSLSTLKPDERYRMKHAFVFAVLSALTSLRAADVPTVFSWPAQNLVTARQRLKAGDASLQPALARLRQEADRDLRLKPLSVMDKSRRAPSGDQHDYLSQAPYWWPDPANPKGPYIRRDGIENPERL